MYQETLGITSYPKTHDIEKFLEVHPTQVERGSKEELPSLSYMPSQVEDSKNVHGTIDEIAEEIRICKSCDVHNKRMVPVAGGGGNQARLFVIGGWLALKKKHDDDSLVFGEEEDRMLERMLAAIGLSRKDAFVTNIIKCGVDTTVQPKAEDILSCLSYLYRQITVVSPAVVCTMGMVASRSLLKIAKPLSQLRGRFHKFHLADKRIIPVMPTYHPTFLLQNPEMKKATWCDLQAIAKVLKNGAK